MKKSILRSLSFLLSLVLACLSFASCNKGKEEGVLLGRRPGAFNDIYEEDLSRTSDGGYTDYDTIPITAKKNTVYGDYGFLRYEYAEQKNYCVYSVKYDRTVLSVPATDVNSIEDVMLYDGYISVFKQENKKTSTLIYNDAGELLANVGGKHVLSAFEEGFQLDNKLYHIKDGTVNKTYTIPPFFSFNQNDYVFTDEYLVYLKSNCAVYYNENFEDVAYYEMPTYGCVITKAWVLSGGKVLFKGIRAVEPLEKNFDYYYATSYGSSSYKAKIFYEIFDPKTNTAKDLSLGVAVVNVMTDRDDLDYFKDGVHNVLSYHEIKDGAIDNSKIHYVTIDNDGKPQYSLDNFVEGQRSMITPLEGSDCYYVLTNTGYTVLSAKGEVLKELPDIGDAKEYGYYWDKKIYNAEFKLVKDLSSYSIDHRYSETSDAILYWKTDGGETQFFIYTKNGEARIEAPDGYVLSGVELHGRYYKVSLLEKNTYAPRYDYRTFSGMLLLSSKEEATFLAEDDSAALVRYYDNEGVIRYSRFFR